MTAVEQLREEIGKLTEEQASQALELIRKLQYDDLYRRLAAVPEAQMPENWPPKFPRVEPLEVEGEPVSSQLIRDRR